MITIAILIKLNYDLPLLLTYCIMLLVPSVLASGRGRARGIRGRRSAGRGALGGTACLTPLVQCGLACFMYFRRVKDRHTLPNYSPPLEKTCARQVVCETKWFPLRAARPPGTAPGTRRSRSGRLRYDQYYYYCHYYYYYYRYYYHHYYYY